MSYRSATQTTPTSLPKNACPEPRAPRNCAWNGGTFSSDAQQSQQFRRQRRKLRACHAALGVNHDVPSCRYLLAMPAHDLSHAPPDAIAHHRAAQRLLDAETEAAARKLIRAKKKGEVGTRAAFPGAVHGIELSAPHQPRF